MILRFISITCRRTARGELTEEPYLAIAIDDNPDLDWISNGGAFWGSHGGTRGYPMRTGQSRSIDRTVEFHSRVRVERYEVDHVFGTMSHSRNDHIGGFIVLPEPVGRHHVVLGPDLSGTTGRHYTITYQVTEHENDSLVVGCLQLISLECHDAQEVTDEVVIKVDDNEVWGPRTMKTRRVVAIEGIPFIPVARTAHIELWENDSSGRSDRFGQLVLDIPENFDFSSTSTHEFRWRRSSADDARYTLTYRVNRVRDPPGENPCQGV